MAKFGNILGIIVGIIIIALSAYIYTYEVDFESTRWSGISYNSTEAPEYETNKSYGGDAYSGIQQAAAQTANNLIPIYDEIQQGNTAVKTLNANLKKQAEADAKNLENAVLLVQLCFSAALLAFGLATTTKHIAALGGTKTKAPEILGAATEQE